MVSLIMCVSVCVTSEHCLCPAGFHPVIPGMFKPLVYVWRPLMLWTQLVWRQQVGTAVMQGLCCQLTCRMAGTCLLFVSCCKFARAS